jgi:hypothetical protein
MVPKSVDGNGVAMPSNTRRRPGLRERVWPGKTHDTTRKQPSVVIFLIVRRSYQPLFIYANSLSWAEEYVAERKVASHEMGHNRQGLSHDGVIA